MLWDSSTVYKACLQWLAFTFSDLTASPCSLQLLHAYLPFPRKSVWRPLLTLPVNQKACWPHRGPSWLQDLVCTDLLLQMNGQIICSLVAKAESFPELSEVWEVLGAAFFHGSSWAHKEHFRKAWKGLKTLQHLTNGIYVLVAKLLLASLVFLLPCKIFTGWL